MDKKGKVVGIGAVRPATEGFRVGPVHADSIAVANMLFLELQGFVADGSDDRNLETKVFMEVMGGNSDSTKLVQGYGFKPVFSAALMHKGKPPKEDVRREFIVTNWEIFH